MIQRDQLWRIREHDLIEKIKKCLKDYRQFHDRRRKHNRILDGRSKP